MIKRASPYTDVFNVSVESCIAVLDMLIDSWDMDLKTVGMGVVLNCRLATGTLKRFEFAEQEPQQPSALEAGLEQFLKDTSLSGDATEEEIEFLKALSSEESSLPRSIINGSYKT